MIGSVRHILTNTIDLGVMGFVQSAFLLSHKALWCWVRKTARWPSGARNNCCFCYLMHACNILQDRNDVTSFPNVDTNSKPLQEL